MDRKEIDFNKKVFLIGLRATGKSSVGKLIAEHLNLDFYDLDEVIVKRCGKSIKEIVEDGGWKGFREIEREVLDHFLSLKEPVVVACGGGAVLHIDTWRNKKSRDDIVIWLDASIDEMVKRILKDSKTDEQRPSLIDGLSLKDEIKKVRDERLSLYKELSDITILTDSLDIKTIKDKILDEILD